MKLRYALLDKYDDVEKRMRNKRETERERKRERVTIRLEIKVAYLIYGKLSK